MHQYSPKLKKAMEEIKEILKKNDIGGSIILHTPGFVEFILELTPSYSCAFIDEATGGLRVINKKEEFNGDIEAKTKKLNDTISLLDGIGEISFDVATNIAKMLHLLKEKTGYEGGENKGSSHIEQNN